MTIPIAGAATRRAFAHFDRIDWSKPWFAPFAERGARWQRVALERPGGYLAELKGDALESGHTTGRGAPLTFIAQEDLPAGSAYEAHIAATGSVPTRENLHDFFNALVWFSYPRVKATLNARHARAIERDGVSGSRGAERDALTLFDENAVVCVTSDAALRTALVEFDWRRLFVAERAAWGRRCAVRPFGHALLEKLVEPYKACTGHAWIVEAPADYFSWTAARQAAWVDETIAAALGTAPLDSRLFAPLPVLGIPGWWPANGDPAFYDDERVFRLGRRLAAR
jgi:Protein of unknown function (DUF3025)